MIFILKEQVMNGTVTMTIMVTGIEADSFEEAVNKFKKHTKSNNINIIVLGDVVSILNGKCPYTFSYTIPSGFGNNFSIFGSIEYKPLKILGERR